jgi:chemotaxis protein methyltransferase CheR
MFRKEFTDPQNLNAFANAIVDTVREPLVVLDKNLRVIAVSRSFYSTFKMDRTNIEGKLLYELGDGEWDIPKLRVLLENIIRKRGVMEDYEVEHDFPNIGQRTMLLNARMISYDGSSQTNILLGIEDITRQRLHEREKDELLRQKDMLLDEIQHRIANSLQIIASIILLKSKTVASEETRRHLNDTHKRVLSIAAVQQQLRSTAAKGSVEMTPYLTKLCSALSLSMIGDSRDVVLKVKGGNTESASSRNAESIGLIVTELVINSLKHAFSDNTKDGQIIVAYEVSGSNWKLSVADNGTGKPDGVFAQPKIGLGTGIVKTLAKQLDAQMLTTSDPKGTTVSITHATFSAVAPAAL